MHDSNAGLKDDEQDRAQQISNDNLCFVWSHYSSWSECRAFMVWVHHRSQCGFISFGFCREDGSVEVQLGQTQVFAVMMGEITQPCPDRGNETSLSIFTEFSTMGNPAFESGRPSEMELGRIVDRGFRYFPQYTTECRDIVHLRFWFCSLITLHCRNREG